MQDLNSFYKFFFELFSLVPSICCRLSQLSHLFCATSCTLANYCPIIACVFDAFFRSAIYTSSFNIPFLFLFFFLASPHFYQLEGNQQKSRNLPFPLAFLMILFFSLIASQRKMCRSISCLKSEQFSVTWAWYNRRICASREFDFACPGQINSPLPVLFLMLPDGLQLVVQHMLSTYHQHSGFVE